MRFWKKVEGFLLAACITVGMVPTMAFADGGTGSTVGNKAIMSGTSGISAYVKKSGKADTIYYGVYTNDGKSYNVPWYVLEFKTTAGTDNREGFLLSKYTLGKSQFYAEGYGYYNGSKLQSVMKGLYKGDESLGVKSLFTEAERKEINATTLSGNDAHGNKFEITDARLFPLPVKEASNLESDILVAKDISVPEGDAILWWLFFPSSARTDHASVVSAKGIIDYDLVNYDNGVRPTFNLNLESVLFSSAAAGGKISAAVSGYDIISLSEVGSYTGSEWKLTLKDASRNEFSVSENDVTGESGDAITLKYTGASVGTNEYVSIIIEDSNSKFTHYGRVAQPTDAVGSLQFTLPSGLTDGKYTLHVFSEQYNGDYNTDYASEFDNVTLTVQNTTPIITDTSATRENEPNATVKFTSSEAGTYYYEVVESGATPSGIDTTGAGTACVQGENTISLTNLLGSGAKDMYIIVKDAAGNKSETSKVSIPEYVTQSEPVSQDNSNETTSTENQIVTETVTPEIIRSPKTGEDSTSILWGLTLIASLSACFTLIGAQRKRNNR